MEFSVSLAQLLSERGIAPLRRTRLPRSSSDTTGSPTGAVGVGPGPAHRSVKGVP